MSPRSRSVRTFLPLFAAALFVGGLTAFAYYQSNDNDGTDDTSFTLPNPPVLAKYSSSFFGQTLLGALAPEQHLALPVLVAYAPASTILLPLRTLSFASNNRGPPAFAS